MVLAVAMSGLISYSSVIKLDLLMSAGVTKWGAVKKGRAGGGWGDHFLDWEFLTEFREKVQKRPKIAIFCIGFPSIMKKNDFFVVRK